MVEGLSLLVHLETSSSYIPEVWVWFAIGVLVIFLRWAVRIRTVGFKGFEGDNYIAIIFPGLFSLNAEIAQITYYTEGNIDVTAEQVIKVQILFFYQRLKSHLWWNNKTLIILFWITGLSYVFLAFSISLTCRPYSANWQMKTLPGPECIFRPQNFWILVFLNVLTDIAIMAVPLPVIWHLRASRIRKFGVSPLLLSGLFMTSTAVIRAARTLNEIPSVININRWGFRETTIGAIAANAPVLAPFFTRPFWRKGAYKPFAPPDPGLCRALSRKPPTLDSVVDLSSFTVLGGYRDEPEGEEVELEDLKRGREGSSSRIDEG